MARLLNLKASALFLKAKNLFTYVSLWKCTGNERVQYTCVSDVYSPLFHSTSAAQIRNQVSAAFSSDFTDTSGSTATDSLTRNLEGSFFMSAIVSGLSGGSVAMVGCPRTCNGTWDHVKLTYGQLCVSIDNWFMCYGRIWMRCYTWLVGHYFVCVFITCLPLCLYAAHHS